MLKKTILLLLGVLLSVLVLAACSEASDGSQTHSCLYDREITDARYLKSNATCTERARYYKSCSCGKRTDLTFEYGETTEHKYTRKLNTGTYLKAEATCQSAAVYYKSCTCGATGEETFEYGTTAQHDYRDGVCVLCSAAYGTEGLEFALSSDGTSYILVGIGTVKEKEIQIPLAHNGLPVTAIAAGAFRSCTFITSVSVSRNVTFIGEHAFYGCTALRKINFYGTKAEWEAVERENGWNSQAGSHSIYCTDGKVERPPTELPVIPA